jgi:hypothetical protein
MTKGMRLAAVAVISAVITATVVIGVGQVWISRSVHAQPTGQSFPQASLS